MSDAKQKNSELYSRIRSGDHAAINLLIEANIGLVIESADRLIERNEELERLRGDLVGAGNLELTQAANRLASKAECLSGSIGPAVTKYLATAIGIAFSRLRAEDSPFGESYRKRLKLLKAGTEPAEPERDEFDPNCIACEDWRILDAHEEIASCCDTPLEKSILETCQTALVREDTEYLTSRQLSELLGETHTEVNRARRNIARRYRSRELALAC